ncbi:GPI-anchored protein LORELEI [Rhynchospora pubera]|uniref:GPI-anchored protein LORELEI n=1 Tax=Rhynchospora pubera TaxID=906938 RepID=A0AAV8CB97_9POAL|nr:GPI-anchored protein LORELEI [Rhynchospora pubera]KAJ4764960.1 GPI-anchored protein LORELEI [Rhynchospora pubera]KAJ4817672.1 GPI-anchored protein LORELEI [Rhynchospora pubera]
MYLNRQSLVLMVLFMALVGLATSSSISEEIFSVGGAASIMELQEEGTQNATFQGKNCPVDFSKQNYTIITSQCQPTNSNATLCCSSFKAFACPIAAQINDVQNNDCAKTMFKNIHSHGSYQPGFFREMCKESKQGLSCQHKTFH